MHYTNAKDLYRTPYPRSRFKGSSLPQYAGGGWLETANYFMNSDQGQKLMGNLGQVGNMVGAFDATDGKMNPYLSTGAGALKGAQMGAKLGSVVPGLGTAVGAGVGAVIGGGAALLKARKEEEAREEAELQKQKEEEYRKETLRVANLTADKGILDTYPTTGVVDAGFMMAYGGDKNPPAFDMSLLAGNSLPAPSQLPSSEPHVLTGYNDAELAANRAVGNQVAFNERAEIVGDNLNAAGQYIVENPVDALQVGLGTVALGADAIPVVGTTVSAVADGVNAAISGTRAAYYANKGDTSNAAFYATAAGLDGLAMIPAAGNAAGSTKVGMLLNKANHLAHTPIHMAHQGAAGVTAYKAANLANNATASTFAMGGKISTESAHYLAEGGEVVQHAVNDRPDTDQNGSIKQLNSNTSLFKGDSHDAPSQGIGVANDQEARIYSKRLYAPKSLVAKLKSL